MLNLLIAPFLRSPSWLSASGGPVSELPPRPARNCSTSDTVYVSPRRVRVFMPEPDYSI